MPVGWVVTLKKSNTYSLGLEFFGDGYLKTKPDYKSSDFILIDDAIDQCRNVNSENGK